MHVHIHGFKGPVRSENYIRPLERIIRQGLQRGQKPGLNIVPAQLRLVERIHEGKCKGNKCWAPRAKVEDELMLHVSVQPRQELLVLQTKHQVL